MKKIIYILLLAFAASASISAYTDQKVVPTQKRTNLDLGLASDPR